MGHSLRMTAEELELAQARIKARSASVQTVRAESEPLVRGPDKRVPRQRQAFALPESVVLRECSAILDNHPCVKFWFRANTGGALTLSGRYVKFSFKGCADLLGMSSAGRFMAIECKATGKKATDDQAAFLENVKAGGGFAVCVDHPGMLALALKAL